MEPLLSELGMAVDAIESRYCTSGQWLMPSALKLQLSKETSPVSFPMPHGQQEKELSRIRAAAEPSPFGHGNQTVVDTTVRKAHQLMPDQVVLSGGFNGTLPADILEKVRSELVPDARAITAKLHKINIYEKGGFFTDHKDTPRSETHFGSLVLLLPAYYKGGALSIDHGGESTRFDWASTAARDLAPSVPSYVADREAKIAAHTPSATLRYAAFFGDATHRVLPVTEGARVTIAYELYRDGAPDPMADALLLRAERCREAFAALARCPTFMPDGGALGFECCHLYEEKELSAAEKTLGASTAGTASARKIKGLKNEDAVLAVAAAAAGLKVDSIRVLSDGNGYSECEYLLDKMPSSARGFGTVRNCDGCRMKGISPDEVDKYAKGGRLEDTYPQLEWVSKRQGAKRELAELEYGEYFGNEASTTTFYTRACLVVK
ncbi:hypothetical protein Ctob_011361, partial [Chrysochromulina tobinii]